MSLYWFCGYICIYKCIAIHKNDKLWGWKADLDYSEADFWLFYHSDLLPSSWVSSTGLVNEKTNIFNSKY